MANGSLRRAITVNSSTNVTGTNRIASAHCTPETRFRGILARRRRIQVSAIWGGTPKDTPIGPAIWNIFLPNALADHRYQTAPAPFVTGHGLEAIPNTLTRLRKGVSAEKLVVTL